jgi:protein TonB
MLPITLFAQTEKAIKVDEKIYKLKNLDTEPEYPGGIQKFYKMVIMQFRTPEIEEDINVKILTRFVVEKDGSISNVEVLKDPGYGLGEVAIKTLNGLKVKWIPGTIKAKPVRCYKEIPINIKVENPKKIKQ